MIKIKNVLLTLLVSFSVACAASSSNELESLYQFDGLDETGTATYNSHKMRMLGDTTKGKVITLPSLYYPQNNEFRATWVGTIDNIHYPPKLPNGQAHTLEELKTYWIDVLDEITALNLNVVIFQVSPMLDALYQSDYRPWSQFVSGSQGLKPLWADSFDLVEWMIEESHLRGLEFHAWFNPYRVTHRKHADGVMENELATLSVDNFARKNPQTAYVFTEKIFLDPGHPLVLEHISNVVSEFLFKYDADAIHLDDYFYPYDVRPANEPFIRFKDQLLDRESFRTYGRSFKFIEDISNPKKLAQYNKNIDLWRIDNNNRMILELKRVVDLHNQQTNRSVALGISPFGIWEHKSNNRKGSKTPQSSTASLSGIYADTLKWSLEEQIDYLIPQVYWEFSQTAAPYAELVTWWQKSLKNSRTHLYIGQPDYKHLNATWSNAWLNYEEIPNQLRYNQQYPKIKGSAFFGYSSIINRNNPENNTGITAQNQHIKLLKSNYLISKAIVPAMPWLTKQPTTNPINIETIIENNLLKISFDDSVENNSRFYIIYKVKNNSSTIMNVVGRNKKEDRQQLTLDLIDDDFDTLTLALQNRAGVVSAPITLYP